MTGARRVRVSRGTRENLGVEEGDEGGRHPTDEVRNVHDHRDG